jgi:hypothetical protein
MNAQRGNGNGDRACGRSRGGSGGLGHSWHL